MARVVNFGGSERYAADLAGLLAAAEHTVLVVVQAGWGRGQQERLDWWRKSVKKAQIYAVPAWVPKWLLGWVLGRLMDGFGPDIVHCHLGGANTWAGRAAKRRGIKWISTLHLRWKNKEMQHADGVICIANWQKKEIGSDFAGKVQVIGNWLPDLSMRKHGEFGINSGFVASGRGDGLVVFGSVGRLHKVKGMDVLVRAFQEAFGLPAYAQGGSLGSLREKYNVRLRIVGEGEQRGELERLIAGDARIELVGQCAEMAAEYAQLDVLVSAARYEPFGLTILEGMAHGLPLVCTRSEGPSEFLAGREGVVWAEKDDVASLAAALRMAYAGGPRRVVWEMGDFMPARAVAAIERFYENVRS